MEEIDIDKIGILATKAFEVIVSFGPKLLLSVVLLIVGLKLIKWLVKIIEKTFEKGHVDITLRPFLIGVTNWTAKIFLFISIASILGIETTSFVTVLGAAGLAIGLALQGTLANLAGGVLCLLFKPFVVGDLIEAQGQLGEVKTIQIFTTVIIGLDKKTVIIPNGSIMNGNITNYTKEGIRRVDMTVGVSYSTDIKVALQALQALMEKHPLVVAEPKPFVGVQEYGDSSINLLLLPYCKPENYWDVRFDIMEEIKPVLDSKGIEIPFPQRDVHIYNDTEA